MRLSSPCSKAIVRVDGIDNSLVEFDKHRRYGWLGNLEFLNFTASTPPVIPQPILAFPIRLLLSFYKVAMVEPFGELRRIEEGR